ncbi:MAG: hypothetical protein ACLGQX_15900, partial [Acidobacteriota bacterium]
LGRGADLLGEQAESSQTETAIVGTCLFVYLPIFLEAVFLDGILCVQYSDNSRSLASAPLCAQISGSEEVGRSQTPR